jgi:hypothetical protein
MVAKCLAGLVGLLLLVVSVQSLDLTVQVHYPEIKFCKTCYFILGWSPGHEDAWYGDYIALNRLMMKVGPDTWAYIIPNITENTEVPLFVHALDFTAEELSYGKEKMQVVQRSMCDFSFYALSSAFGSGLNAAYGVHSAQVSSESTTAHLYPYFCVTSPEMTKIYIQDKSILPARFINIVVPGSLLENTIPRPVTIIYLLDGYREITRMVADMLATAQISAGLQDVVLVGLDTPDRGYEYSPWVVPEWEGDPSGGGIFMKNWILNIVEPEIAFRMQDKFIMPQSRNSRHIAGVSLGGLEAMYLFYQHTAHFSKCLAMSPALQWNNSTFVYDYGYIVPQEPFKLYMSANLPGDVGTLYESIVAFNERAVTVLPLNSYKYNVFEIGFHVAESWIESSHDIFTWLLE